MSLTALPMCLFSQISACKTKADSRASRKLAISLEHPTSTRLFTSTVARSIKSSAYFLLCANTAASQDTYRISAWKARCHLRGTYHVKAHQTCRYQQRTQAEHYFDSESNQRAREQQMCLASGNSEFQPRLRPYSRLSRSPSNSA